MPKTSNLQNLAWLSGFILTIWSFPLYLIYQLKDSSLRVSLADLALLILFGYLFKRKHPDFKFSSNWQSSLSGVLLILLTLAKITNLFWFEPEFIALGWWLINLGLIMILLGYKNIKFFWGEILLICLFLAPLKPILAWIFDLRIPTAVVATFGLHYLGMDVSRIGSIIIASTRAVDVNQGCTALDLLTQTYKLVILLSMAFSLTRLQWLKLHLVSLGVPFVISVLRVMLLTVIVSDRSAFTYWHTGGGGNWFALMSLLICVFAWLKIIDNLSSVKFSGINISQISTLQKSSLSFLAVISLIILLSSFGNPAIARREVSAYDFPLVLAASNSSQALPLTQSADRKNSEDFRDRLHSARIYEFNRDNHPVTLELRYLVGTTGNLSDRIRSLFSDANTEINFKQADLPGVGSYQFWQIQNYAHLSTCLFADGVSRIRPVPLRAGFQDLTQFKQNLINWIFAKTPLRDRRCIWVHGFTPDDQLARTKLLTVWQKVSNQLKNQFPPI